MVIAILLLILTGLSLYLIIQPQVKVSEVLTFSVLLGIIFHSMLFYLMGLFNIYYSVPIFLTACAIPVIGFIAKCIFKKERIKITNDLRGIPLLYIGFLAVILYKFIIIALSTTVSFNNWDELISYQYLTRFIYVFKEIKWMYNMFAPVTFFIGNMSLQFSGFNYASPRIFGGIMYVCMSLFIYSRLRENKVNRYIAALIASIFLISSGENFLFYITFYNNVYYACFVLFGIYLLLNSIFKTDNKREFIIGSIFLLGACLVRRESVYHMLAFVLLLDVYLFIIKHNYKKKLLGLLMIVGVLFISWNIGYKLYSQSGVSNTKVYINFVSENVDRGLPIDGIPSFFKNAYAQMFKKGDYTNNFIMFGVAALSIIIFLIKLLLKKLQKYEKNMYLMMYLMILIYFGIVFATEFFLMTRGEFLSAASFTRYMLQVVPILFIVFGSLMYANTSKVKPVKALKKITKKSKVILIIPAYNEEKSILKTIDTVNKYNQKNHKYKLDIVVINDGSKDKTEEILTENKINHVKLIQNLGIGGAVQTGYIYAFKNDYDVAIQFDGDGQHDVNYVEKLIDPIVNGEAHIVIGSRFIDKETSNFKSSLPRRIGIKIISVFIKFTTRTKVYDTTSGFRAVGRDLMGYFAKNYPTEYPEPISLVEVINDGYKIKEVPANMLERKEGRSSIVNWKQYYYMVNILISILIIGIGGRYYDE